MQYRALGRTGEQVSVIGFGAAPLGDEFGPLDPDEGRRAVRRAVEEGVNFFDVAPYYGRTLAEKRLGEALQGLRDEVFLATKCCRYDVRGFDFSAKRVERDLEASLRRLRTDWVDLLQVHDVEFATRETLFGETLPALLRLRERGDVRFVGVTGLALPLLRDLAATFPLDTVLWYCHGDLLVDDMEAVLGPTITERGTALIHGSPLAMGLLTEAGPPDWHPAPAELRALRPRLVRICREHGRRIEEVALRYALDHALPAVTLSGISNEAMLLANLAVLERPNDPALVAALLEAVGSLRHRSWHEGLPENNPCRDSR